MGIFSNLETQEEPSLDPISGELDLEGIDDVEIDREYLRTPEEVEAQEEIWMAINGEFMVELEGISYPLCFNDLYYIFPFHSQTET